MKLEQHFYTSGKPEFMTVAITAGISRKERIQLESNSIYFLPVSLHYQEDVTSPVKYIWYPLGENLFVVGRAVYAGKDNLGRTGNYLFHNYVIRRDDLLTICQGNPAALIKYLRRQNLFQDEAPSGDIQPIRLADDTFGDIPTTGPRTIDPRNLAPDLLQHVLHACLDSGSLRQPVLLLGTDAECLDFLEQIYTVLPYTVRLSLQVDTYAYGVSLDFPIIGSVDDDVFRQGLSSSFTLRLSSLETTVYDEFPAPSRYVNMLLGMISTGDRAALNALFSLEYLLTQQQFAAFNQEFQQASLDIRRILWDFYGSQLLDYIAAEHDMALLRMIRPLLKVEHIDTLYLAPELIEHLVEDQDPAALSLVAQWLCAPGSKELFYPALFASEPLWVAWLAAVQAHPETAHSLVQPLKAFAQNYSVSLERILLEHLLPLLPALLEHRKLAKDVADLLADLPPQSAKIASAEVVLAEIPAREEAYLTTLRTFIRYEVGNEVELLDSLLTCDLTTLSTSQRAVVLETLLDKILMVRALKIWSPEKAAQQLRALLTKAEQDSGFAVDALTTMSKLELSKDAHKVVEQVLADLQSVLVQGTDGAQIRQLINHVLEPPPSIFSKLTQRLFRLK